MNFLSVLLIICITLFALMGCYLLITKKGRRLVNGLLAGFFLLWALDFLDGFLLINGFYLKHADLAMWIDPMILLYGPSIYLFTKYYLEEKPALKFSDLKHALPFIFAFLLLLFVYHLRPVHEKQEIIASIITLEQPPEAPFVFLAVYIHFFLYLYHSKKQVKAAAQRLLHFFSQTQLLGILRLLRAIMLLLIISIINSFLQFYSNWAIFEIGTAFLLLLVGVLIVTLILKALDQSSFFEAAGISAKYSGSSFLPGELDALREKITKAMETDCLYLNPELTIDDLSGSLGLQPRMVSQTINAGFGKNFFDFINTYRIEAAQQLFMENTDPKLTVLEVMYQVGFNSKSSFNTQFRKKTGKTPSEFIRYSKDH